MVLKHFSHSHDLVFQQVPQGSQIQCSAACKSPGSGDIYACWQCNYFLHKHCFNATRSLNHPSHPLHPLTLALSPTYPSGSFTCNSCNLTGDGLSYSCAACEFDIHVHCALIPNPATSPAPSFSPHKPNTTAPAPPAESSNPKSETSMTRHFSHPHLLKPIEIEKKKKKKVECSACESNLSGSAYTCTEPHCSFNLHKACFDAPREVRHKFHPHPLTLLASSAPVYADGFNCDACQKDGKAFVYHCATCSYDLHIDCLRLPETVSHPDHGHPLTLSTPVSERFMCDVCNFFVNKNAWVYYCRKCDFGTHLECVHSGDEETGDVVDRFFKLQQQQQMHNNIIRMQLDRQNTALESLAASWRQYMLVSLI